MISDLLEVLALACLTVAAFVIFHLAGVLIAGGISLMYLSRVYGDQPLPRLALPKLALPKLRLPARRAI